MWNYCLRTTVVMPLVKSMRKRITLCYGCVKKKPFRIFYISTAPLQVNFLKCNHLYHWKHSCWGTILAYGVKWGIESEANYMLQRLNSQLCASKHKAKESFALHNNEFVWTSLTATQTCSAVKHAHWSLIHIELPVCYKYFVILSQFDASVLLHPCFWNWEFARSMQIYHRKPDR